MSQDAPTDRLLPGLSIKILLLTGLLLLTACRGSQAGAAFSPPPKLLPTLASTVQATRTAPTISFTSPASSPTATRFPAVSPSPPVQTTATPPPAGYVYYPSGRILVPILLYHNVGERGTSRYVVRPAQFRAQMNYLHVAGYQAITISQLAGVIRDGGWLPEKPVVITFDDGYLGVHQTAFPILAEYGFPAVVYIISGTVATDLSYGYLQKEQVDDLAAAGWEVGSHSISHSSLKTTRLGLQNEVEISRQELEERLGVEVRSFSYPYNITSQSIRDQVQQAGYESAVGVDIYITHSPDRLYFLSRREVFQSTTLPEFRLMLTPGKFEDQAPLASTPVPDQPSPDDDWEEKQHGDNVK